MINLTAGKNGVTIGTDYPMLDITFYNTEGETLYDGEDNWFEYYESTYLTDGQYPYGDWWANYDATPTPKLIVTSFKNNKLSAEATVPMFDALDALVNENPNPEIRTLKLQVVDIDVTTQNAPEKVGLKPTKLSFKK